MASRCNRCKQVPPLTNDTYCLGCSAWEATGRELQSGWDNLAYRTIAVDILVATCRNVRALRNLGAAEHLAAGSRSRATESTQRSSTKQSEREEDRGDRAARPAIQRKRASEDLSTASPKTRPKREDRSEREERRHSRRKDRFSEDEETDEEEDPDAEHRPLGAGGERKPPEPDGPPPSHRGREAKHRTTVHPWQTKNRHKDTHHSDHRGRHHRSHRAGRKHQRLARVTKNPFLTVHRRLPAAFLDRKAEDLGLAALEEQW